jgi:hypothetical protein
MTMNSQNTQSIPSLWTSQFDIKNFRVYLPTLQEPKSDQFLKSVLQRKFQPFRGPVEMKVEFDGCFSLPDSWKSKMVSI